MSRPMTLTPSSTDIELLRDMRGGKHAAFQALYLRHQGPLFRYATLRSGSQASAADIVQEIFIGLLTDSFQFDPLRGQLGHFLFGVARKLILKHEHARRLSPLPELDEGDELELPCDAPEPLARMLSNEVAEQVRQAIALLPPHYRDIVILYEMHDLSYLEIAAICQIEIGTVRSRLSRARAALAKRLGAFSPVMNNAA
ncbi:MAG: RNA polymerase sigma factor [Massilia sp.]